LTIAPGEVLSEDGRVMVLRALLAEKQSELKLFHATARLPGFAQEISAVLRELQQHQLSPEELLSIARWDDTSSPLREKLHDIALLLRAYRDWLKQNHLHDTSSLLDLAVETLTNRSRRRESAAVVNPETASLFAWAESRSSARPALGTPQLAFHLWLDGFAEMTSQELNLLAAIIPFCERATLAFCLEAEPRDENASWLSLWSVAAQTYRRCLNRLSAIEGSNVVVEVLQRDAARNRFSQNAALAHLEASWPAPRQFAARQSSECAALECADSSALFRGGTCPAAPGDKSPGKESGDESPHSKSISIVTCANPEAEAVLAAREILHFVRERGARFRDAACCCARLTAITTAFAASSRATRFHSSSTAGNQ
jgi:ATP-dependent helicase/nuclease subunit B